MESYGQSRGPSSEASSGDTASSHHNVLPHSDTCAALAQRGSHRKSASTKPMKRGHSAAIAPTCESKRNRIRLTSTATLGQHFVQQPSGESVQTASTGARILGSSSSAENCMHSKCREFSTASPQSHARRLSGSKNVDDITHAPSNGGWDANV